MSKMGWIAYLAEQGNRDELIDYLSDDCYFKNIKQTRLAADRFLKVQRDLKKKKKGERIDEILS